MSALAQALNIVYNQAIDYSLQRSGHIPRISNNVNTHCPKLRHPLYTGIGLPPEQTPLNHSTRHSRATLQNGSSTATT